MIERKGQSMETKPKVPKEKRKNNEKRKERSRNAARCRRSKESELYCSLASSLPFANDQPSQLDKASVMRLAISYLKIRNMIGSVSELSGENKSIPEDGSYFLKTLEGFVMILSEEGDFIYLSENVSEYLGINQIDLMGQNIYEYSHPCDHDEIKEMLSGKCTEDNFKSIFIRMKCTLTTKGRSVTLKSAVYKVIHSTGHVIKYQSTNVNEDSEQGESKTCFISVSQPIPHPSNIESPLPKQTFLTKHNMDMKFTHADDELMKEILGYEPDDLLGKSVFEYYHAIDMDCILSSYKCLFSKGQCQTGQYRFLAKSGGYVWLITQATLINDKNQKPQSVVCVNYVISGLECKDEVYSTEQYLNVQSSVEVPKIVVQKADDNNNIDDNIDEEEDDVKSEVDVEKTKPTARKPLGSLNSEQEGCNCNRPISATSSIFAPRTEDMNKGFLTFSDEEPGLTMLKDEPEDLTHLAPVAGDVCVPLEDHPFLPEMLDDILLRDNLCPLLSNAPSDPFMSYRDFQDPSPQLLSPNLSKHSDCSLTSLNSPCDSLMDDDASAFMNLPMDDVDLLKSPYTSMNISDDLPLLISNDLMWNTGEKKYLRPGASSSLAQLLTKQMKTGDRVTGLSRSNDDAEDVRNAKNIRKSWTERTNISSKSPRLVREDRLHCGNKRSNSSSTGLYEFASKKTRNSEPKDELSSELLHQLISNNAKGPKDNSNNADWLLNGNVQKAACVSQPSESVLMNLLGDSTNDITMKEPLVHLLANEHLRQINQDQKRQSFRKLLDPDASSIASLMDLTQQDFEVNAPVEKYLLQGVELLRALDANTATIYLSRKMSPDTNGNPPNVVKRKKKVSPTKLCVGPNPSNSSCNCYTNAHICNGHLPLPDVSYYSVASSTNASHMLSLPSLSSSYNYNSCLFNSKTMPDIESTEYSSLPAVNMQSNEAPAARRFSDPGLPNDSDSSTSTIDDGVVHKLKSQIGLLGENNRRLTREVDQLRLELNLLKQQSFKSYGREYEPGLISDIIREVRDATKVREESFLARVKHLIEEQQQQLELNHLHFLSEKQKNNERISKLEEQLKNFGLVSNRVENNSLSSTVNSSNSRQVLELEREALELRRELQDTRAKKEASDQKVLLLDKKIQNLMRCDEIQSSDVSDDSKTELESVSSRENTGNSSMSQTPRITLSGPVTDL